MASDKDLTQAEYFRNRVAKNEKALRRWARAEGVEALRLYDRDIPEIPLALDRYGGSLLLALYERPYEKDEELEAEWLGLMARSAAEALSIDPSEVFFKRHRRQRGAGQYERQEGGAEERTVREGGLSFLVNLSDYLDTGLFLDHRPTRALVRAEAAGKEVLNLFSYTGSFSVYAAAGGAARVTSVDLSNTYLAWAGRNLALNGLDEGRHPLVRADAIAFLAEAAARGRRWDLIIADPPTFSNSASAERDFDVNEDWPGLLRSCAALLAPGGRLYFSTNSRRLKWSEDLAREAAPGGAWEDIGAATLPPDFRDRKTHRCWRLTAAPS
jgi:23S rRNA (guanine2445-N2)-methyltransferase / 23S rRNA (guanine2069-N7)-methyltransferase